MSDDKKASQVAHVEGLIESFTKKFRDIVVEVLGEVMQDVKLEDEKKEVPAERPTTPEVNTKTPSNVRSIRS